MSHIVKVGDAEITHNHSVVKVSDGEITHSPTIVKVSDAEITHSPSRDSLTVLWQGSSVFKCLLIYMS